MTFWDQLLKTGLPLEVATSEALVKRGYGALGEQPFTIEGEFHSADMRALKLFHPRETQGLPVEMSLFIECKYITDGEMVFGPHEEKAETVFSAAASTNAITAVGIESLPLMANADLTSTASVLGRLMQAWIPANARRCTRGVVPKQEGRKGDSLSKALFQLAVPLVETYLLYAKSGMELRKSSSVRFQWIGDLLGAGNPQLKVALHVPIVVTNAKLFVLHRGVGFDKDSKYERLSDVADEAPFVNLVTNVQSGVARYLMSRMEDSDLPVPVEDAVSPTMALISLMHIPRRFYVVTFGQFDTFLDTVEKEFITMCAGLPPSVSTRQ